MELNVMLDDLRYALRMLMKSPGFTAVVVLSLGLGIGTNATVFCWIQNILLRPLPGVEKQEELVAVTTVRGTSMGDSLSVPDLTDQAKLDATFAGVIGSVPNRSYMTEGARSDWIYGQIVTANFFNVLRVNPLLGRTFLPEEDGQPGGHPVMVISENLWKRRFAGDSAIIGRAIDINGHFITIVGIIPGVFRGTIPGLLCDFWAPLTMCAEFGNRGGASLQDRSDRWVQAQARLRPGLSIAQAQASLDILNAQLQNAYPNSNNQTRLQLLPLWKSPFGFQKVMLPVLGLLQAVSLGVLLIVAVNVANLLLARATLREREVAIRIAIGAARARLIRQLLTESLLLSLIGGAFGLLLTNWMVQLAGLFIPYRELPVGFSVTIHSQTLALTFVLTLATGLTFGLLPALQTSRPRINQALKEGGRSFASGAARHRVLNSFVVSQISLAMVLLICAGLCLKGLGKARELDLGFEPEHLLFVGFDVDKTGDLDQRVALCRNLQQHLASLPGVQNVGYANWYPLGFDPGVGNWSVDVEGYPRQPNENLEVNCTQVSTGYFAAMQIPLFNGREFADHDDQKAPGVVIINQAMAQRFWSGRNPIGHKFNASGTTWTVVSVAKTGKYRSLAESPTCFFYIPISQWPYSDTIALCLRATGNPLSTENAALEQIHRLSPRTKVWETMPMTDYIQAAFMGQQIASSLLALLGIVVLSLAAMGVYGVMAYVVGQRTREFGIRMALGAQRQDVRRLVLRRGLLLASVGAGIGVVLSLAVTHLLASFLYGVSPFDATTFTSVPLILGATTLLACYLPARAASSVDPMVALRCE
jgi:predicted permease